MKLREQNDKVESRPVGVYRTLSGLVPALNTEDMSSNNGLWVYEPKGVKSNYEMKCCQRSTVRTLIQPKFETIIWPSGP